MPCSPLPGGGFSCSFGPRPACAVANCSERATAACDWPLEGARRATCDMAPCERHRWRVPGAKDRDYCPTHRRMHEEKQR